MEHRVSSAKVQFPEHILIKTRIAGMHCKSLWIKASAKCINVNEACISNILLDAPSCGQKHSCLSLCARVCTQPLTDSGMMRLIVLYS